MPLQEELSIFDIETWINHIADEYNDTHVIYTTHYWYLDEFSCILVKRNKLWFAVAQPKIEEIWKLIEKERISGYEHRAPKKRTSLEPELFNSIVKLE
jgi:hypothetical protein